jgi:hypothetical protein
MKKQLETNDNARGNQERPPQQQQSGDKRNQRNEGKALQVNDNSAGAKSPAGRNRSRAEGLATSPTSRSFKARLSK